MQNPVSHPEAIRDFKRILDRHKWRFIIPFFVVAQVIMVIGLIIPRKYEAQAIFERRNDLVMSEIAGRGAPQSFNMLKKSLVEELGGITAVERVVNELGIRPVKRVGLGFQSTPGDHNELLQSIRKRVQVHYDISTPQVDRIRVVYTDGDPEHARDIVNTMVKNYIDRARGQIDDMLTQASSFFDNQVQEYSQRIDALEDRKLKYEITHGALLPDDPTKVSDNHEALESEILVIESRVRAIDKRIERLQSEMSNQESGTVDIVKGSNPEIRIVERELREYQEKLDEAVLIKKMTDKHPTVISYREKVKKLEERIAKLPREVVTEKVYGTNAKRTQLELALLDAQQQHEEALATLTALMGQRTDEAVVGDQIYTVRAEYRKIERAIEDNQRQLKFWEDNHRRVKMSLTAELGQRGINMAFIKPSGVIRRPSSPDLMHVLFAALLLGGVAGMGCVLFTDRTDQTVHSTEQANRVFDVPVMGAVQEIYTRAELRWRRFGRMVGYPLSVLVVAGGLAGTAYLNYMSLEHPGYFSGLMSKFIVQPDEIVPVTENKPVNVEVPAKDSSRS